MSTHGKPSTAIYSLGEIITTYLANDGVGFSGVSPVIRQAIAQVVMAIQKSIQNFEQVLRVAISRWRKNKNKTLVGTAHSFFCGWRDGTSGA